jgi:hypothetical protein
MARMRQNLLDQACSSLQRALTLLEQHPGQNQEALRNINQKWRCYVLYQLGVVSDRQLNRSAEVGETYWRQCMVMLYTADDRCSCAHVRHPSLSLV